MKISYAITVCNELEEIQNLVTFLSKHKKDEDEIVITFDSNNGSEVILDYLKYSSVHGQFSWHPYIFDDNFSDLKNYTKENCSGDYIFHIDADEIPHEILISNLHEIVETNDVDLIWVPRVNTVEGLTQKHIKKWGWKVNAKGWVNYPDYQARIFRNSFEIMWEKPVHEYIVGCKTYSHLPPQEELGLYHHKHIDKQEQQNKLYEMVRLKKKNLNQFH